MARCKTKGRSRPVTITMPPEMAGLVKQVALTADRAGGVSAWVRQAIRERLEREAASAPASR